MAKNNNRIKLQIYKNIDLEINEKVQSISLTILSIEFKTWLD